MEEASGVAAEKLSRSEKIKFIERQRQSGMTQAEFCRREGLSIKKFYAWRSLLRNAEPVERQSKFVELKQAKIPTARRIQNSSLELKLPNGAELKFVW